MPCVLCERPIRKGHLWVMVRPFVTVTNAYGTQVGEPLTLEDGSAATYAHMACFIRKCPPELLGIRWGEPRDG
jgi:hypothetical protein